MNSKCWQAANLFFLMSVAACGERSGSPTAGLGDLTHAQGEMAGEVGPRSAILQSRLTRGHPPFHGEVPGFPGVARFEISTASDFVDSFMTEWLMAAPETDYVVKDRVAGLEPGTRYHYRLQYGRTKDALAVGPARTFRTLYGADRDAKVSFVVVTGMSYYPFQALYDGPDKALGYPALDTIVGLRPDFFIGTGDNVYYDVPSTGENTPARHRAPAAKTASQMRAKWHEQFVQPRFVELFAEVPTYWEKDDHDYRYNDCDNTSDQEPLPDLGRRIFREQVPIVDPDDSDPKTYRTHRVSRLLQIWLTEGRDYRSPNMIANTPAKTLWGVEQKEWLKRTLLASDAVFKVLVSPTPMIGPDDFHKKGPSNPGDDDFKRDNHSNPKGFSHERDEFFGWLEENELLDNRFFIVCGDRHWQYHSISPNGVEEFSCGALTDSNSRLGLSPGDPESNDPQAEIRQPYTQQVNSGGFLKVAVLPTEGAHPGQIEFTWFDEHGEKLHGVTRAPK